jgi:acyl-CoA synthetase (AMP-forming)/AMP-acid ligase II
VEIRVVDTEIEVRGPMMMDGYLGHEPLRPGAWFRTGDLGHLDPQGNLHVHGRRDDLIITGGENVHPSEVEQVILAFDGVVGACVFGVPDDLWGHRVVAVVQADPSLAPVLEEHLVAHLGPHKRPKNMLFVDELPVGASGKVDRQTVKRLYGA